MKTAIKRAAALALLTLLAPQAMTAVWADAAGKWPGAQDRAASVAPAISSEEMELLLREGKITRRQSVATGTTGATRITLTSGRLTHDAQLQNVDVFKAIFEAGAKHTEFNFRDSYRYNIAAYRLARLLGLTNVPMTVARQVDGGPAAITWWIDDVVMDEGGRMKLPQAQRMGPNAARTISYTQILRVFDELIQNRDRNLGNLVWTKDWTMWMIDHTRAFRTDAKLIDPGTLQRCDRNLYAALRTMTRETLTAAVGDSLIRVEIDAVLARRDLLVDLFESKIKQSSEAVVDFHDASVSLEDGEDLGVSPELELDLNLLAQRAGNGTGSRRFA